MEGVFRRRWRRGCGAHEHWQRQHAAQQLRHRVGKVGEHEAGKQHMEPLYRVALRPRRQIAPVRPLHGTRQAPLLRVAEALERRRGGPLERARLLWVFALRVPEDPLHNQAHLQILRGRARGARRGGHPDSRDPGGAAHRRPEEHDVFHEDGGLLPDALVHEQLAQAVGAKGPADPPVPLLPRPVHGLGGVRRRGEGEGAGRGARRRRARHAGRVLAGDRDGGGGPGRRRGPGRVRECGVRRLDVLAVHQHHLHGRQPGLVQVHGSRAGCRRPRQQHLARHQSGRLAGVREDGP
mmetsp:Transcript_75921/g.201418  ORF Transcript_75921/g.201418 Transcript_75921/m.201418 type:complete len:294 (-) Transcript_75921:142-1023(-)